MSGYDGLRSAKVDPREDKALAITMDGRKLALDARLIASGNLSVLTLVEADAELKRLTLQKAPRRRAISGAPGLRTAGDHHALGASLSRSGAGH